MKMTRRGFMQSILAAGISPAIVRANSIMPVIGLIIPESKIILAAPQEIITAGGLAIGERIFAASLDTMAFMEAKAAGLIELRRMPSARGGTLVEFILPREHGRLQ